MILSFVFFYLYFFLLNFFIPEHNDHHSDSIEVKKKKTFEISIKSVM